MDIIEGSNLVRFKFCWSHAQYEICEQYWPWTAEWWRVVPSPLRVKITRGSAKPIDDDARGTLLPRHFVPTLKNFTMMKFVSEITKHGLKPGTICHKSARNCVHFCLEDYDAAEYSAAAKRLAEGDLSLPARIGYPPRGDAELILNCDRVFDS